jgi:hypothetical protein
MIRLFCLFCLGYLLYEGITFFQIHHDEAYQVSKTCAQAVLEADYLTLQSLISEKTHLAAILDNEPPLPFDGQRRLLYHRLLSVKNSEVDKIALHLEQVVRYDMPGEHTLWGSQSFKKVYEVALERSQGHWAVIAIEIML